MNTSRIFIASSSELETDRNAFREFLSVENDRLHKKDVYLELVQWEHFLDAVSETRLQDEYNEELKTCDILVCLFYSKAGKYTLEEFETALRQFKETGKPLIYTYFKKGAPEPGSQDEQGHDLVKFKRRLAEIGHFHTVYDGIGDLKYQFRKQLDRLEDSGFIAMREELRFVIGVKAFNEYLTKSLIGAIQPYSIPAQRFLEKVAGRPDWETQLNISDKAKEIIAYSFAGVIGIQLRKLMAVGKEDFSEAKVRKYIEKCIHIAKRSIDLVCFALISTFWDAQKHQVRAISDAQRKMLSHLFDDAFEPSIVEQLNLLKAMLEIFANPANKLELPIPELEGIAAHLQDGSELHQVCQRLQSLNEKLDKSQYALPDCFEAEIQLAAFLKHFRFLVNYRMASIKDIGYRQIRNSDPHYLHRYAALGIDSKANMDAEKINYTPQTVYTDAVLLYRGDNYQEHINLFPFVIDYNALTLEHGSKICFFSSREINDGSLEYLFLEDNSIVPLEWKGIQKPDTDFNELMMSDDNRKILNLDGAVGQFREARRCLCGDDLNLDDL
jgi:hypothetical protein